MEPLFTLFLKIANSVDLVNNVILLFVASLLVLNTYFNTRSTSIAKESLEISRKTEINTNSMIKELIKANNIISQAIGLEKGRAEGRQIARELKEHTDD